MKDFIRVMKALSEPNRVKIVKMLQRKSMCVCELQDALGIAQSSVSKHLRILEDAGIVDHLKEGLWVNYYIANGGDSPYVSTLMGNMRHWLEDDHEVSDLIHRLPGVRREEICRRRIP